MRWLIYATEPREGTLRKTRKFAFFPTRTSDGFRVWLEFYELVERADYFGEWRIFQRLALFTQS
jgi:hypothetical protein